MKNSPEIRDVLREAFQTIFEEYQRLDGEGATSEYVEGDDLDDFASVADRALTSEIEDYFGDLDGYNVLSEEGDREFSESDDYTVIVDEFDGTDNMLVGEGELPFGPVIAIAEDPDPAFNDVAAAGYLELTSGNYYEAFREEGASLFREAAEEFDDLENSGIEPQEIEASDSTSLDPEKPPSGIVDIYMTGDSAGDIIDQFNDVAYQGDFRSWAEHMALVARGAYDFAVTGDRNALNPEKRATAEELAAGHLLITEAGGTVTDWQGKSIAYKEIGFHDGETFDVVVAGTEEMADKVAERLPNTS